MSFVFVLDWTFSWDLSTKNILFKNYCCRYSSVCFQSPDFTVTWVTRFLHANRLIRKIDFLALYIYSSFLFESCMMRTCLPVMCTSGYETLDICKAWVPVSMHCLPFGVSCWTCRFWPALRAPLHHLALHHPPPCCFQGWTSASPESYPRRNNWKKKMTFSDHCAIYITDRCKSADSPRGDDVIPHIHGVQFSIWIVAGPPSNHELERIHRDWEQTNSDHLDLIRNYIINHINPTPLSTNTHPLRWYNSRSLGSQSELGQTAAQLADCGSAAGRCWSSST